MAGNIKSTFELVGKDSTGPAVKSANKNLEDLSKSAERLGKAIIEGFAVRQIYNFGKELFNAFSESEAAMNRFTTILYNIPEATKEVEDALVEASSAVTKFGFDDEQAAEQMANFYARTKDVTTAIQLNSLAMDIAKGSGKSYQESAAILTQVLNGQTKSVKALGIEIGDLETPLTVTGKLIEKYGGAAAKSFGTAETATKRYSESFANFKEVLGKAIAYALVPLMNILSSLFEWFSKAPTWIKVTAGVVTTLATGFSLLALGIGAVNLVWPTLLGGINAIKIAMATTPIGWITIGLTALVAVISILGNKFGWFKGEVDASSSSANGLKANLERLGITSINTSDGIKQLTENIRTATADINKLQKDIAKTITESGEKQLGLNQDIGSAIVEQEQKIADLTQQISEEKHKKSGEKDQERIEELQSQLEVERASLDEHKSLSILYVNEVAEARRLAGLTEFARKIEQLKKEKEAEQTRLIERVAEMNAELALKKSMLDDLLTAEKQYTQDVAKEREKAVQIEQEAAKKIAEARQSVTKMAGIPNFKPIDFSGILGGVASSTKSILGLAGGGSVSSNRSYIVGEDGPELFSPSGSGSIIPNNRLAGAGGITINITGNTLLDGSAGDKLAAQIMRTLKQNLRI